MVPSFFVSNKRIEHACYTEQYCAWTMAPLSVHSLIKGNWVINIRFHCLLFLPERLALILTGEGGTWVQRCMVGRGAYYVLIHGCPKYKVAPQCIFILVHHNDFRAFLYKCIYLIMSIYKLRWQVTPPWTFFPWHWRRWFNEKITLFIKKHISLPVSLFVLFNWQL